LLYRAARRGYSRAYSVGLIHKPYITSLDPFALRPARAVALAEVGIGQALDQVPGAVGDGHGAAQMVGDGIETPGLGPAGVDDRDTGQAQGSSDAHAAVRIEPLAAVILTRILLA